MSRQRDLLRQDNFTGEYRTVLANIGRIKDLRQFLLASRFKFRQAKQRGEAHSKEVLREAVYIKSTLREIDSLNDYYL